MMKPNVLCIVLVEDNPGDAHLIQEMIVEGAGRSESQLECKLEVFTRLSSAMERITKGEVSLILADLGLPDSQGLDTLRSLQRLSPNLPIVVLTGLADESTGVQAMREGAEDYLLKGEVDMRMLVRTIRYAMERKKTSEALRESQAQFKLMADSAPMFIWMCNAQRECTLVNKHWLDFTGRTLESELGSGWLEAIHHDDLQYFLEQYRIKAEAQEKMMLEFRMCRANGEFRWLMWIGVPRVTPEGELLGYIGSALDITDRKRAEEAAREVREKLFSERIRSIQQQQILDQQQTQIQTLREVTLAMMDKVNNPLAVLMMVFDIWERTRVLPPDAESNFTVARNAAHEINNTLKELLKVDRYRTADTSFGKMLDLSNIEYSSYRS